MTTSQAQSVQYGPSCLTILPTFKCTAACANCCFGSHPWIEGRIPQDEILRYIREAAEMATIKVVVFSGGECFLLGDDLVEAIALATNLGLLTRCVTNGYWATTIKAAERVLGKLVDAGLTEINFSTGDNHLEYVPIENIILGTHVARRFGLNVSIMVEVTGTRAIDRQTVIEHPLYQELLADEGPDEVHIAESPWISMDDGQENVTYSHDQVTNRDNLQSRGGCESILGTIVATPQRELFACCGITSQQIPEVKLGLLDDASMKDMYDRASKDFLKIWLAADGPEKIVAWASQFDDSIEWENRFSHQCDTCQFMYKDERVRAVIAENYEAVMPDVLFKYAMMRGTPV